MMVRVTRIHGSGRKIDGHRWQTRDHQLDTATLAYDSLRKKITLFGGYGGTMRGDTWEWDGNEWTQVANTGPPARWGHTIVYDSDKQKVVLFGGLAGGNRILNDTWEWDGNEWTQVADTGPSARGWHSMVYDSSNDLVVLFGGVSFTSSSFSGETWKMKDNVWKKRTRHRS